MELAPYFETNCHSMGGMISITSVVLTFQDISQHRFKYGPTSEPREMNTVHAKLSTQHCILLVVLWCFKLWLKTPLITCNHRSVADPKGSTMSSTTALLVRGVPFQPSDMGCCFSDKLEVMLYEIPVFLQLYSAVTTTGDTDYSLHTLYYSVYSPAIGGGQAQLLVIFVQLLVGSLFEIASTTSYTELHSVLHPAMSIDLGDVTRKRGCCYFNANMFIGLAATIQFPRAFIPTAPPCKPVSQLLYEILIL